MVDQNQDQSLEEDDIQSILDQLSSGKFKNDHQGQRTLQTIFKTISSPNHSIRIKSFSAFAIILQQQQQEEVSLSFIQSQLESLLHSSTDHRNISNGLASLSAILLIDPQIGLQIIQADRFLFRLAESIVDLLEIGNRNLQQKHSSTNSDSIDLKHSFSEFIALALNHKLIREILVSDWPDCLDWLTRISSDSNSTNVSIQARCAASLALVKLRLTADLQQEIQNQPSITDLTKVFLNAFITNTSDCLNLAIEGLALVSQNGSARELLMKESEGLLKTIKLVTEQPSTRDQLVKSDTSIAYGIASILVNLSAYQVLKNEQDQATDRLKKLAQRTARGGKSFSDQPEEHDEKVIENEAVFEWIQNSLRRNNDLMDTIGWLVRSESKQVKRTTGKLLLNLVERQACRGAVLQAGGGRMLMKIIATLTLSTTASQQGLTDDSQSGTSTTTTDSNQPTLDPSDLEIIQALAKILITTNPLLIFGPSADSPVLLSTIRPLTLLLVDRSSTLLQTFEALMALTNLSSLGVPIPGKIAQTPRVLSRLEECMIGFRTGENEMVRRAATELVCNLSSTPQVIKNFEGPGEGDGDRLSSHVSRLHLLIALSSSDDLSTALAASGGLAILTEHSKTICRMMIEEKKLSESLLRILKDVFDEGKIGVQVRLVSLLANLVANRSSCSSFDKFFDPSLQASLHNLGDRLGHEDQESVQLKKIISEIIHSVKEGGHA